MIRGIAETAQKQVRTILLLAVPLYALYNYWYPGFPLSERATLGLLAVSAFFVSMRPRSWLAVAFQIAHLLIGFAVFGYIILNAHEMPYREGIPNSTDIMVGIAGVYLILVAVKVCLGSGLAAVTAMFLLYLFFGQHLPVWLGGHRGFSLERIISFLYLNDAGIMGFAMSACLKYMALFLILGKVLQQVGAMDFVMGLSRAFFGTGRTGPPLMAVMSSALVGTVSGSTMGNVYISGNMTIPLMRRVGIRRELAAAIEAAASSGGQIMPPVMGFAVFLMIVLLDVAYVDVIVAALIPATLYFLVLGFGVWLRIRHMETPGQPHAVKTGHGQPSVTSALLHPGLVTFLCALGVLVYLLANRNPLQTSVMIAMAACLAASLPWSVRITPGKLLQALVDSGRELIDVAIACLALGIIAGTVLLTGLGTKLPALMIEWSTGNLLLLLICSFLACIVLGLGIPSSLAYMLVALLISHAIVQLGVELLDAHLFVFYAALAAMITPPVALAAYAAASIAKSNYWTTGWLAAALGMPKYLVPFAFIFRPQLLMRGSALEILAVSALTLIGLAAVSLGLTGTRNPTVSAFAAKACLVIGGILLSVPPLDKASTIAVGAALCMTGTAPLLLRMRRQAWERNGKSGPGPWQ
ncbi:MAG: TRAP transporter fused permease subunit [Boseongicola sp. SB0675_bin_26]|nr:TRAP transporter fused permease subunit [Boseongicola sp. SB0675_bin_26]